MLMLNVFTAVQDAFEQEENVLDEDINENLKEEAELMQVHKKENLLKLTLTAVSEDAHSQSTLVGYKEQ
ncbi:MAG: hypothetical protein Q9224_007716, partial [Gallowayella concinna]